MTGIAQASLPVFKLVSIAKPKLLTPLSNGFIGDGDVSFGQEFFHLTKTEAEPMVEPNGVTDNFGGEPVTVVAGCWLFHAAQSAKSELS